MRLVSISPALDYFSSSLSPLVIRISDTNFRTCPCVCIRQTRFISHNTHIKSIMPPSTQSSQSAYHTLPRPQHDSHHLKAQPSQSQRPPLNRTPTPLPKFMPMPHGHSLRHPKSASPLTISTTSLSTKDRRIDKGKGVEVASTPVAFPSTVDAVASVAPISPHTIRARMFHFF